MNILAEIKQVEASADLLYSKSDVEAAIAKMAEQINLLLSDRNPLILCAMNGGVVLAGKLLTHLTVPLTFDSLNATRYNNSTSGNQITWLQKPNTSPADRTVLIVDDILDEGVTLRCIHDFCLEQGATSVYTAVLLDKQLDHPKPIKADFVGLEVENRYLFGYGMDYKGYLRNAAGIYACKETY